MSLLKQTSCGLASLLALAVSWVLLRVLFQQWTPTPFCIKVCFFSIFIVCHRFSFKIIWKLYKIKPEWPGNISEYFWKSFWSWKTSQKSVSGPQNSFLNFPSPYFGPQCPFLILPQPKIGPQCPYLAVPPHIIGPQCPYLAVPPHIIGPQCLQEPWILEILDLNASNQS